MAGVLEENRRRLALILALVGIGLILIGFLLVFQHQSDVETAQASQRLSAAERVAYAQRLKAILFFLVILVVLFSVSLFALMRWSRSFRRTLLRRAHAPTPVVDAWAMHRLPPDTDLDGPKEPPIQD